MVNHTVQDWLQKIDELEQRPTLKQKMEEGEIYEWGSECIALFTALGVSPAIISGFGEMFANAHEFSTSSAARLVQKWNHPGVESRRISGFFYPSAAFRSARLAIDRLAEQERLVPHALINILSQQPTYSHLATELQSIEAAFQSSNSLGLISASQALLESIINLHPNPSLRKRGSLKLKLQLIVNTPSLCADFGVDADLFFSLHVFRHLRNKTSSHVTKSFRPTLSLGYGYASLILYLLNATLSQGTVIHV